MALLGDADLEEKDKIVVVLVGPDAQVRDHLTYRCVVHVEDLAVQLDRASLQTTVVGIRDTVDGVLEGVESREQASDLQLQRVVLLAELVDTYEGVEGHLERTLEVLEQGDWARDLLEGVAAITTASEGGRGKGEGEGGCDSAEHDVSSVVSETSK